MSNAFRKSLCLGAVLLFAWVLPGFARADHVDGPRVGTHTALREVADDAEQLSDSFRKHLDRALDHTIIDGTKKEKQFEKQAKKLENALDKVRSAVRGGEKYKKTRNRVKRALKEANKLDDVMLQLPIDPSVQSEWEHLLARLNQLAVFYELAPVRSS